MTKEAFKIQIRPTIKQGLCWEKLKDKDTEFVLFGGGAGGGKSWLGCEWLLVNCIAYPKSKWFIGRNELKRLMMSSYVTFNKVCDYHNIPRGCWKLNAQHNYIQFWNGSRIDLIDVQYKPSDQLYERFGSCEYTGGWLEEVGEIKGKAFDVLKSRINRHMNDEYDIPGTIFLTCNPKKNWVYNQFYKPWKNGELPDDSCFIQSLYNDNPHTAKSYGRSLSKIRDTVLRERLKLGLWEYSTDDSAIIEYEKIIQIFTRDFIPRESDEFYLTVDNARMGRDKAVFILWQGYHIRKITYYDKTDSIFVEKKIRSYINQYHIARINVVIDQDGASIADHIPGIKIFVGASGAITEFDDDKKYREQETVRFSYANLRSQCYFTLANYINDGIISCYKELDQDVKTWLIEELEAVRRKDHTDNQKKLQIISKDDIKDALGARSPDFSDSVMMRMLFGLGQQRETVVQDEEGDDGGFEIEVAW